MATLQVHPRQTPAERANEHLTIDVDEALAIDAAVLDDWVAPRQNWEVQLREGHEFGRANNVEETILRENIEEIRRAWEKDPPIGVAAPWVRCPENW